jgi:4-hydroxybenzoate polyprenyltransferase
LTPTPLVVDLDGTLLDSDLLFESAVAFARDHPLRLFQPLRWLLGGKAALKHGLAYATEVDVTVLPYNQAVLAFVSAERARGRPVILATASHRRLAEQVAAHLQLFDLVVATEHHHNLSACAKRDVLVGMLGDRGFDYVGNSRDDLPVWGAARQAFVVNAPASVVRKARAQGTVAGVIATPRADLREWTRALRLHQWLKNLLLFVALLASHRYGEWPLVRDVAVAFLSFGLCASGVYILNDLIDLRDDRHHATKRCRPFASGRLSIPSGLLAAAWLQSAAFGVAVWQLPLAFTGILAGYTVLTLAYSLWLKRHAVIDVITLASLYTVRVIAGAAVLGLPPSFWLLAFSMFVFLSLAFVKRYAELHELGRAARAIPQARGRGYSADDLAMVSSLGASSGYLSVLVLALYINDSQTLTLYRHPEFIWLACPLLLTWMSRVWMLAHRGRMHEDPVIFAVRDRVSLGIGALLVLVFWAAT